MSSFVHLSHLCQSPEVLLSPHCVLTLCAQCLVWLWAPSWLSAWSARMPALDLMDFTVPSVPKLAGTSSLSGSVLDRDGLWGSC